MEGVNSQYYREGSNTRDKKEEEEERELELEKETAVKKRDRFFNVITGISIFVFVFAIYMFMMGSLSNNRGSEKELENQGVVLYTLNAANPLNVLPNSLLFNNFFSKDSLIIIILLAAVVIVLLLVIFVYIKIWKIKKIRIQAEAPEKIEEKPKEQEFSDYNKKVLELIREGNRFIDKSDFLNARITYHKIRGWYDSHSDKNKKIYYEIIRFYQRIVSREI